jgi:hypothetical protein
MSYNQQGYQPTSHRLRFFIVVVTLLVGAVFTFLLMGGKGDSFFNTAAVTDLTEKATEDNSDVTVKKVVSDSEEDVTPLDEVPSNEGVVAKSKSSKGVSGIPDAYPASKYNVPVKNEAETSLSFDTIPLIKKQVRLDEVELVFQDLPQNLYVNDDRLQLGNIGEVTFIVQGFNGEMSLGDGFSLNGRAKRIELNGISLSTDKDIKLSFSNINYQQLKFESVELKGVAFPRGSGQLNVGGKLSYALSNEGLKIDSFRGSLNVDKGSDQVVRMEGITQGLSVSGESLGVDVR